VFGSLAKGALLIAPGIAVCAVLYVLVGPTVLEQRDRWFTPRRGMALGAAA
jgi:hypothetical protein